LNEANYIGSIIEGGRVTVPEAVRKALNLKQDDLVQINIKKVTS
jgi:bifunctional DNA-binding transcriptional regulator/antitoxin component of YhaV-PrlF toxin-antitoxin module